MRTNLNFTAHSLSLRQLGNFSGGVEDLEGISALSFVIIFVSLCPPILTVTAT